jgi:hypothetical protein
MILLARRLPVAAFCAASLSATWASADDETCRSAYVETQRLQRAAQFLAARREAVVCGQDSCSDTVRSQCSTWLESIERALPTVVIDARDGTGAALADVRVEANGELLAERLSGRALELNPGEYVLLFRHGTQRVEQHTLIRESEKYRTLEVRFDPAPESAPLLAPDAKPAATQLVPASQRGLALSEPGTLGSTSSVTAMPDRALPAASYVLGGLGLVGLTTFAVLASSGYASEQHLRSTCAGACEAERVDAVRTRYRIADASLTVGIVSLGAAVAVWLWTPNEPRASVGLSLGPQRLAFDGQF